MTKKLSLSGVVGWDFGAQDVRDFLRDANGADVEFICSSPGGLVSVGIECFNLIRNYPGKTTAILSGYAMSMMSYIPLACDEVVAEDNAVYMIHNARGGVWGDHNDILSYGTYVKGLSGLLGKQYVKKTGKAQAEITEMMDKETFFFGEEMVEAGFVDRIIATEKDKDKDTALFAAQAVFADTMAALSKDAEQVRADMVAASSLMGLATPTPATAGKQEKEVTVMKLNELLAQNPAAKAEFDALIAAARSEGELAVKAVIDRVAPLMQSGAYPATVAKTALAVLKGEQSMVVLDASVAAIDALREEAAAEKAAAETAKQKETPAGQVPGEGDVVSSEEDLTAAIAKAQNGEV
jgi:ATP-dependent protease ClpP protease subunit